MLAKSPGGRATSAAAQADRDAAATTAATDAQIADGDASNKAAAADAAADQAGVL